MLGGLTNTVLLGVGVVILLIVVAAAIEAYVKGRTHRPLVKMRPEARTITRSMEIDRIAPLDVARQKPYLDKDRTSRPRP